METLQERIARRRGFHILQHKMEIYGICSECLKKRSALMPLAMAKAGEKLLIKEIAGGREARARLASMGLRPGDSLEVISNDGEGRIIVGAGSTRLALGRGLALKILVTLHTGH
jgi:Fur family ferric uptake transcriptional regulator